MSSTNTFPIDSYKQTQQAKEDIRKALEILAPKCFEIRVLTKKGNKSFSESGYFDHDHLDECVKEIMRYYHNPHAQIYLPFNEIPPDALAYGKYKIKSGAKATSDGLVSRRLKLLIDIDPERFSSTGTPLSDLSATDEEKENARSIANQVIAFFTCQGWGSPIFVDSGNGFHLYYDIDLPNTEQNTKLIQNILVALSNMFGNEFAKIDCTVFNASRIAKLPGTIARKGDSVPDRPHRPCRFLEIPSEFSLVTQEQLEAVATLGQQENSQPNKQENKKTVKAKENVDLRTRIENYLAKLPQSISGEKGHDALFRAACVLVQNFTLSPSEAWPYLQNWNISHCSPPWNDKELWHKLHDADKAHGNKPRGHLLEEKSSYQETKTKPSGKTSKAEEKPKYQIKSIKSLLETEFPETLYLVPGILPAQGVNLIVGKPKTGKSSLVTNLVLALAYKGVFLGQCVEKANVLYLNLEDGERRLKQRIEAIIAENEQPPDNFDYIAGVTGLDAIKAIDEWLAKQDGQSVVVIDTLAKFRGLMAKGQNMYEFDYHSLQLLRELAEKYQATFLLIHHTNKLVSEDVIDLVSGSLGLSGAADNIFVLKRARGNADAEFHIVGRDMEDQQLALRHSYPYWTLLGNSEEYCQSEIRRNLISILQGSTDSLSIKEIVQQYKLEDPNVKYGTVKQRLYQMYKAGQVKVMEGGKYAPISNHNLHNLHNQDNSHNPHNLINKNNNKVMSGYDGIEGDRPNITTNKTSQHIDNKQVIDNNANSYNSYGYEGYEGYEGYDRYKEVSNLPAEADNDPNTPEIPANTTINSGQRTISDADIAPPLIVASPEAGLARRALACGEWLVAHPKIITRVMVSPGETLTDPLEHSYYLHRQFKQGVQLPDLLKELDAIELAVKEATRNLNASSISVN